MTTVASRTHERWRRTRAFPQIVVAGVLGAAFLTTCGSTTPSGRTLRVPGDEPTIQAAVDHARPGDLVLVAAGTYHESVRVLRRGVTIRGEDRNTVVLDGEYQRENGCAVEAVEGESIGGALGEASTHCGVGWRWRFA